ncbi:MAG: TonB family protein [Bacteroidota bacterium]
MKTDLNKNARLYFTLGLLISLTIVNTAFEWEFIVDEDPIILPEKEEQLVMLENIPITKIPDPPKPKIEVPKPTLASKIVESIETEKVFEKPLEVEVPDFDDLVPSMPEIPEEPVDNAPIPTGKLEVQPEPIVGFAEFYKSLSREIKYPKLDTRMGIEGRVFVRFVIELDGTITQLEVIKGVSKTLDEEALRALTKAPKWKPGKQRGNPVRTLMVIPINFKLN